MKRRYLIAASFIIVTCFTFWRICIDHSQFISLPIIITPAGTPAVMTTIEGKQCLLKFDSGSKYQLSLTRNILESIVDKKVNGIAQWRDLKGNFYESPTYQISDIKIGSLVLKNVIVSQEDDGFINNTTLWNDNKNAKNSPIQCLGTLGRPLLQQTNLLFDCSKSVMIACNNKQELKKTGYSLENMSRVPFEEIGTKGIIIKVDTDRGILKLSLDTGATITLVRSSLIQDQKCTKDKRGFLFFHSSKFSIGEKDFGGKNLFFIDITPELHEIDGILGMDFLEKHTFYIDYKNKMVYFK